MAERTCVECSAPLTGRQTTVCSKRCRVRRNNNSPAKAQAHARWRAKHAAMCDWCGAAPRRPSSRYCSDRCSLKVAIGTSQELVHVGRSIRVRTSQEPVLQTERTWRQGRCLRCGEQFTSAANKAQRWCSRRCKQLDKHDRRRAVKAGSTRVDLVRRWWIFETHRKLCYLCSEPIDMMLGEQEAMSPTLDHVVPLVEHGEHTEANLRPAHRMCNSLKSIDEKGAPY